MRVVVCTVVHHPADARIRYRQIRALLDGGHDVTYIAPHGSDPTPWPKLTTVAIPRAAGRRRIGALRAARRALSAHTKDADLLLVHDPELLLILPLLRGRPRPSGTYTKTPPPPSARNPGSRAPFAPSSPPQSTRPNGSPNGRYFSSSPSRVTPAASAAPTPSSPTPPTSPSSPPRPTTMTASSTSATCPRIEAPPT